MMAEGVSTLWTVAVGLVRLRVPRGTPGKRGDVGRPAQEAGMQRGQRLGLLKVRTRLGSW